MPLICPLPSWSLPPESLKLAHDEVYVWRASLDQAASQVQNLWQTLTAEARARAERFYFPRNREHFIAARRVLRAILGRYLNRHPSALRFCHTPYGKPVLTAESGGETLRFNVSHSHGLALYAIARSRELGINVEHIRPDLADEQIAEPFFSAREVVVLRALPSHMRTAAFFHCWTRKEAYIKGRGEGLSLPLEQFDVSLIPGEPAALLSTQGDPCEAWRWSLQELIPGPGYMAALAVEGHHWRLACWQWPLGDEFSIGRCQELRSLSTVLTIRDR
jgi:4'-phosphopantetheinyl transferase